MKAIKYTALLLAITAMASCQKEDTTPTYDTDPEAVKFTAPVGSPFTRSNPVDDAVGTAFKTGDVVAVSAGAQGEVKYTLSGTAWKPEEGKYLRWETETLTFNAYYPVGVNNASMTAFDLPADQSALAKIEQADYMTYTSPAPEAKAESIALALTRKTTRVVIGIKFLETHIGSTVEKIEVHSNTNGYKDGAVKSGQITIASLKHTDGKFYVLLSPTTADAAADFITITLKKADGTIETFPATSNHVFNAGKSYALDIEVGNNKVNITNITVTDWATGRVIPGGEASASIADPTTHTVHIDKAGELTDALIAIAMGAGKDLKITGAMGTADFATLLKWGTEGFTNSDADLLYTLDLTGVTGLTAVPKFAFVAIVEEEAYSLCSLQHIALPSTVTSVEGNAFVGCTSLTSFTAPELQTVEESAFWGCTELASFTAPKLQTVEAEAFGRCASLASFTATKLLTVGEKAFLNCTSLTEVTAPELRTVETDAFAGCTSLASFTADELQTVGDGAFIYCSWLASFTAPELQTVGDNAFQLCASLTKLIFPKLTTIWGYSFINCHMLTELRLTTDADIKLDENAFAGFPNNACILYLHKNKKSDGSGKMWGGVRWNNIVFVNDDGTPIS